MQIIVAKNPQAVGEMAATLIAAQLTRKPASVLGLATGSTPLPTYAALARMYDAGTLQTGRMTSFNLDEYVGLPQNHEQSYYTFMWENLFSKIGVRPEQAHLPSGSAKDLPAECARYDAAIAAAGGIDLQLLGIGLNGHIGFNEPDATFSKGTQVVNLTPSTIAANRRFFASEAEVPRKAITAGVRTIFEARSILLLACGAEKADIIRAMAEGDITPNVPASVLQLHRRAVVLVDEPAAAKLSK